MPDQEGAGGTVTASPPAPTVNSPTEAELWEGALDELEEADPSDGGDGAQAPSREDSEADEDETADAAGPDGDDEDSTDEPDDEKPVQGQSRVERDAQWIMQVAANPAAIQNVPKRLRKDIRAGAEAVKIGVMNAVPAAQQQTYLGMLYDMDDVYELDALFDEDREEYDRKAAANPRVAQALADLKVMRTNKANTAARPAAQQQQAPPQAQAQVTDEYVERAKAFLADIRDDYGEDASKQLAVWANENGLRNTPDDLKKLKAHAASVYTKSRDEAPAGVQRRRTLPKPDVSQGQARVQGRFTPEEMNAMSEDELWAKAFD